MSRRTSTCVVIAVLVLVGWAAPAAAHGGATETDVPASDYRTEITSIAPEPPPGVVVQVIDASTRLELRNSTSTYAVVLGYEGEPYLKVGPDGVYENRRSPATFLNRGLRPDADIPDEADAEASPEWRQVSTTPVARWHDHRAHWMGPTSGGGSATATVVVPEWSVPIRYGDEPIVVTGRITRIGGPSPVGSAIASLLLAIAVAASAVRPHRRWGVWIASVGLAACVVVDVFGRWTSTDDPIVVDGPLVFVPAGIVFALVIGLALDARGVVQGTWMLGCAGLVAALLLGVAHLDWLNHSQLPTGLSANFARLATVGILGFGFGLAGYALTRELSAARRARPSVSPSTGSPP